MKKSRFTEEQIVAILAEADRGEKTIGDVCREQGVSEPTFYNWRKRFRGMGVEEVREYRELKQENARLKRLLADRELEIDAMKTVMRKKL
ncbi:MAG: transposase [Candidatus Bipolaricaulota bacterium]